VQRFTPLVIDAARPCRHSVGDRWFVDETYVKVAGVWRYVYRAVDQHGQVIDVYVSKRRNIAAATGFFETMLLGRDRPREVTTDLAATLLRVVDDLLPDVVRDTTQYANKRVEWDHGRLKARLRPMRGLRTDRTATTVIRGHAFIQNVRRGHYELGVEDNWGVAESEQVQSVVRFERDGGPGGNDEEVASLEVPSTSAHIGSAAVVEDLANSGANLSAWGGPRARGEAVELGSRVGSRFLHGASNRGLSPGRSLGIVYQMHESFIRRS
jgi:transposase-like protein